ncbi:hypothetical protein J6590_082417, partial [Homalodisca vitripennis]
IQISDESLNWIYKLDRDQLKIQCDKFKLASGTVRQMRAALSDFVKSQKKIDSEWVPSSSRINDGMGLNLISGNNFEEERSDVTKVNVDVNERETPGSIKNNGLTENQNDDKESNQQKPSVNGIAVPTTSSNAALGDPMSLIFQLQQSTMEVIKQTADSFNRNLATALNHPPYSQDGSSSVLRDVVAALPYNSGGDPHKILKFLSQIFQIFNLKITSDQSVILNILPKTEGRLRNIFHEAVTQKLDWPQLRKLIIRAFFPGRLLREAISRHVYRTQRQQERFTDFVDDIRAMCAILTPEAEDHDIFETIMGGILPDTRACFAGLPTPSHLQNLIEMGSTIDGIREFNVQQTPSRPNANYTLYPYRKSSESYNSNWPRDSRYGNISGRNDSSGNRGWLQHRRGADNNAGPSDTGTSAQYSGRPNHVAAEVNNSTRRTYSHTNPTRREIAGTPVGQQATDREYSERTRYHGDRRVPWSGRGGNTGGSSHNYRGNNNLNNSRGRW